MIKTLAEVSDIIPGYAFKQSDFVENSISIAIKIKDIQPPYVNLEKSSMVNIPEQLLHKFEKYRVKDGDILIAMTGATIGKAGRVPDFNSYFNVFINQRVCRVDPKKDIDKDFLYFLLSSYNFEKHIFNFIDSQTAQPNISAKSIGKYQFDLPDLPTQKRISSFILSLENKIKINLKLNKSLEELAQTLYKHWLIDFEFPNEEGKPYKSSGGEMVESELGMIPKGWEIVTLKSLNKFIGGFSFKGNRNDSIGKFKIITIGNVLDGLMDLSKSTSIEVLPDKLKEEQKLNIGDILLSLTGNVGRVCMVNTDLCLLNQRVEKLQPIQNEFRGFMYFLMRSTTMFNTLQSLSRGSAQQNLSPVEVSNLKIAFSRKNTLFEAFNSIRDLILNNQLENIRIISLRDLLLPRLMSGEIEV